MPEPEDLRLWRERQRAGLPTPWEDAGIRLLEDDEVPELLDDSYLTEDDLAEPGIRANVRAMAETNALIAWVAEEDGERAYGYWNGPADPSAAAEEQADGGAASGPALVSLDTEGQYMMLAGRTLTEALCAEAAEYEDGNFAALVARARGLAAETDAGLAASLVTGEAIAELRNPAIEGPGRYRDARYAALRQEDSGEGAEEPDPAPDPVPAPTAPPAPSELPEDLLRWRARAAAGETAPWDRFGVRFLAEAELPSEVVRSEARAAESGVERDRIEAEATRATTELATWVLESDDGVALGYWHGPEGTPTDAAPLALLEPSEWFDAVRGRTLTDAMCLAFGEYEDELIAPLARECRALGFEVAADAYDDFPEPQTDGPSTYRYEFKKRLEERARTAGIEAAEAAAEERARRSAMAPRAEAVVTGELPTLIAALGHGADDAEAQAALALFGPPFERSQYPVGAVTRTYYVAERKHAELIFEDGVLEDVRIWVRGSDERGAYARPEGLIDGVGPDTTREQILERFGTPEWSNAHADRFWTAEDAPNRVFVRFEYVDGQVSDISLTRESPEQ
ncbi:hypothetical protein GCM10027033_14370 [Leucobacter ruminantium]